MMVDPQQIALQYIKLKRKDKNHHFSKYHRIIKFRSYLSIILQKYNKAFAKDYEKYLIQNQQLYGKGTQQFQESGFNQHQKQQLGYIKQNIQNFDQKSENINQYFQNLSHHQNTPHTLAPKTPIECYGCLQQWSLKYYSSNSYYNKTMCMIHLSAQNIKDKQTILQMINGIMNQTGYGYIFIGTKQNQKGNRKLYMNGQQLREYGKQLIKSIKTMNILGLQQKLCCCVEYLPISRDQSGYNLQHQENKYVIRIKIKCTNLEKIKFLTKKIKKNQQKIQYFAYKLKKVGQDIQPEQIKSQNFHTYILKKYKTHHHQLPQYYSSHYNLKCSSPKVTLQLQEINRQLNQFLTIECLTPQSLPKKVLLHYKNIKNILPSNKFYKQLSQQRQIQIFLQNIYSQQWRIGSIHVNQKKLKIAINKINQQEQCSRFYVTNKIQFKNYQNLRVEQKESLAKYLLQLKKYQITIQQEEVQAPDKKERKQIEKKQTLKKSIKEKRITKSIILNNYYHASYVFCYLHQKMETLGCKFI